MSEQVEGFLCPNCGSHRGSQKAEGFGRLFVECDRCRAELFWPLPTVAELVPHYSGDTWYNQEGQRNARAYESDPAIFAAQARAQAQTLAAHGVHPPQRVIEIGCSYSPMNIELRKMGFDAWGLEYSEDAIAFMNSHGGKGFLGGVEDLDFLPNSVDAITSSHALEHMIDPFSTLRRCYELLRPGGAFVSLVPHWGSLSGQVLREKWKWFGFPDHLHYFRADRFAQHLAGMGFKITNMYTVSSAEEAESTVKAWGITRDEAVINAIQRAADAAMAGEQLFVFATKPC